MVTSGGVVSFLSSQERINNKLKIKLITDNFFILKYTPNYSVKLKTPNNYIRTRYQYKDYTRFTHIFFSISQTSTSVFFGCFSKYSP